MMTNASLTNPSLAKARRDLDDAAAQLGTVWTASDHDSIGRLANASEALARAIASVALAVERLAELPACDGSHFCDRD